MFSKLAKYYDHSTNFPVTSLRLLQTKSNILIRDQYFLRNVVLMLGMPLNDCSSHFKLNLNLLHIHLITGPSGSGFTKNTTEMRERMRLIQ